MREKWNVILTSEMVVITPQRVIDKIYDDLWLEVTGNMTPEDKKEIAQFVCDRLNREIGLWLRKGDE